MNPSACISCNAPAADVSVTCLLTMPWGCPQVVLLFFAAVLLFSSFKLLSAGDEDDDDADDLSQNFIVKTCKCARTCRAVACRCQMNSCLEHCSCRCRQRPW